MRIVGKVIYYSEVLSECAKKIWGFEKSELWNSGSLIVPFSNSILIKEKKKKTPGKKKGKNEHKMYILKNN